MIKRLIYCLLVFFLSLTCMRSIHALNGSNKSYPLESHHNNHYDTLWRTGFTIIDTIDSNVAFCLEPDIVTAANYFFTKEYPLVYNNGYYYPKGRTQMNESIANRLGLIAYYGYYSTAKSEFDRCLTQAAIWYYLNEDELKNKAVLRNTSNTTITYEEEIQSMIEKATHHEEIKPFNGQTYFLQDSEPLVLKDDTNHLHYFEVMTDEGVNAYIDGENLVIQMDETCDYGVVYLVNDANKEKKENLYWLSNLSNPSFSYQILTSPYYQKEAVVSKIEVYKNHYEPTLNFDLFKVDEGNPISPFYQENLIILQKDDVFTPLSYVTSICQMDGDISSLVTVKESDAMIIDGKMDTRYPGKYKITFTVTHHQKTKELDIYLLVNDPPTIYPKEIILYTNTSYLAAKVFNDIYVLDKEDGIVYSVDDHFLLNPKIVLMDEFNNRIDDKTTFQSEEERTLNYYVEYVDSYRKKESVRHTIRFISSLEGSTHSKKRNYRYIKEEYLGTINSDSKWTNRDLNEKLVEVLQEKNKMLLHSFKDHQIESFKNKRFIPSSESNINWVLRE